MLASGTSLAHKFRERNLWTDGLYKNWESQSTNFSVLNFQDNT